MLDEPREVVRSMRGGSSKLRVAKEHHLYATLCASRFLETLEPRRLLTTFPVTTNSDSGAGSLRQAIVNANANTGSDVISFAIGSGNQTIQLGSTLPIISDPVVIDGSTQPGYSGAPLIELNGQSANTGLTITAGNSNVRGLILNRFRLDGIELSGNGGNTIQANYIGTNNTASGAVANAGVGVYLNNSPSNTIGGTTFTSAAGTFSARNVISGNTGDGIFVEGVGSADNVIRNNYIGTNLSGSSPIANRGNGMVLGSF